MLGGIEVTKGGALLNGISVLVEETPESCLSFHMSTQGDIIQEMENNPHQPPEFSSPRTARNKHLLFKAPVCDSLTQQLEGAWTLQGNLEAGCCGIILLYTGNVCHSYWSIKNRLAGREAGSIGGTAKPRRLGGRRVE